MKCPKEKGGCGEELLHFGTDDKDVNIEILKCPQCKKLWDNIPTKTRKTTKVGKEIVCKKKEK